MNKAEATRHLRNVVSATHHRFGRVGLDAFGQPQATCLTCQGVWSGPGSMVESFPCTALNNTAILVCAVPGCTNPPKKTVAWYWKGNKKTEVAHACAEHAQGLVGAAHQHSNFRNPSMSDIPPQRAKVLAMAREAAFEKFVQAAKSMQERAYANGHRPQTVGKVKTFLPKDEVHNIRCRDCGAHDEISRTADGRWKVSLNGLTNATCAAKPIKTVAHDSGDGETIYHCPFCGSGQVIARSDRTVECEFCHTAFTVQVQPEMPAFPQTINGMPVQVPGMPGEIGQPPVDPSQLGDPDQAADQATPAPGDPDAMGDPAPGDDTDEAPTDDPGEDDEDAGASGFSGMPSASNQPPWLRGSSRQPLRERDYVAHVALRTTGSRERTLAVLRSRG